MEVFPIGAASSVGLFFVLFCLFAFYLFRLFFFCLLG